MNLPAAIIHHLEGLTITQGQGVGEPFRVLSWQRRFLRGAWSTEGDAALTVGRGCGKTTLVAAIADATLRGPLRQPRAETIIAASSFSQARITFEHLLAFMAPIDRRAWRVADTRNSAAVECRATGARVRCIGSDPRRAHGLAPALVLADEVAQWEPAKLDRMLAALRTSLGKVPGAKMVSLGTRAAEEDHPFERLLRDPGLGYAQVHAARVGDPPFRRRTWKRANPSLDHMPHLEAAIRREAEAAKRDPSLLASFLALRLNAGVSDIVERVLLDAETWKRIEGDVALAGPYVLGVDLGQNAAMSAVAAYWPTSGRLECFAAFPQLPSLRERGLADGVGSRYLDMHRRGELIIAGQRVVDVPQLLREVLTRWGAPSAIVSDRWREAELRQSLEAAGTPLARLVVRGQGYRDGGEDVRLFRAACTAGRVRPVRSLLLRSAVAGARTTADAAGNHKLAKSTQGGRRLNHRDDAAAAAILAVAEGERGGQRPSVEPAACRVVG